MAGHFARVVVLVAALIALLLGSGANPPFADAQTPDTPVLDQQQLLANGDFGVADGSLGQSFQAGVTGQLSAIALQIECRFGTTPSGTLAVYAGALTTRDLYATTPPPTPLLTQPIALTDWPASCFTSTPVWVTMPITTPLPIRAGQHYTFVISGTGGQTNVPRHEGTPNYPHGRFIGGPPEKKLDLVFRTYVALTEAARGQ